MPSPTPRFYLAGWFGSWDEAADNLSHYVAMNGVIGGEVVQLRQDPYKGPPEYGVIYISTIEHYEQHSAASCAPHMWRPEEAGPT